MSITTTGQTIDNGLQMHNDAWTVYFKNKSLRLSHLEMSQGLPDILEDNMLNLISKNKKILMSLNIGLYNFYYYVTTIILRAQKEDPEAIFILDTSGIWFDTDKPYTKFLYKILDDLGTKYESYDMRDYDGMYIDNFYTIENHFIGPKDIDYTYEIMSKYVIDKNIKPFRKVYVSRGYIEERNFPSAKPGLKFSNDNRIINEKELEDYLSSCGFEIIRPEDFKSFEDQINYFYEAKVIMSLTSSGMTNSIFMQPGNIMIELVTPLVMALGDPFGEELIDVNENIHHLYHAMAYTKNHTYIGIQNQDREPKTIKSMIDKNEILKEIFLGKLI